MKRPGMALAIGVAGALAFLITTAAEEPTGRTLRPSVTISGAHSHVTIRRYHRVTSAELWRRIWQEHMGKSWQERRERVAQRRTDPNDLSEPLTFPMIDFENYMVIGIFDGEGHNCTALTVVSVYEEDKRIVLRYKRELYQTMARVGTGVKGDKTTAYGLFVVPRSVKPVVVEENVQNILGDPPLWQECMRFPNLAIGKAGEKLPSSNRRKAPSIEGQSGPSASGHQPRSRLNSGRGHMTKLAGEGVSP